MSTNYYFEVKNSEEVINKIQEISKFISQESIEKIEHELKFIHIGKRSAGWKPIFQAQEYFKTIEELKQFYNKHVEELIIKSEYNEIMTWNELEEELFKWSSEDGKSSVKEAIKNNYNYNNQYYIDEFGYEWLDGEFS